MAQTKRKRRSKHRGNAVGMVEARGRTGRKPTPAEQKKAASGARGPRPLREPTWNAAFLRAAIAAILLFFFTQIGLTGQSLTIGAGIGLAIISMVIYVPLGYYFDRWVYRRRVAKEGQAPK